MKGKKDSDSNLSDKILDSEDYRFFTGTTCQKCNTRFPRQITLSDYIVQCPECGTKVK